MDEAGIPSSEQLLADIAWIRRLARALVRDDATADDVVQETWLVAAEQQPDVDRPLRPWLARVVVNLARTRRRGELRRGDREQAYEDPRTVPTPAELIERIELQRAVADEVLKLAEPYRSTLLLHFVEGISSADIARRLELPAGTVRRRLKTGVDQLREALRRRPDQPKRGWLAALSPLAALPGTSPAPAAIGVLAMKKLIGIALAIILLLALIGAVMWRRHARASDVASAGESAGTPAVRAAAAGQGSDAAIPAWLAAPGAPSHRIAGRVVYHGEPVAGAKVELGLEVAGEVEGAFVMDDSLSKVLQPIAERTSAADGSFDFGVQPAVSLTVSAATPTHAAAAVNVDNTDPHANPDHLVVALGECAPRVYGSVLDASGGGIAHARLSLAGLSGVESDAAGAYSLCLTPRDALGPPSAEVRVEADGYGTVRYNLVIAGDLHHDVVLVPEAVIVGRVTGPDGAVAGARVIAHVDPSDGLSHASGWTTSGADGRFRIAGLSPGTFHLDARAQGLRTNQPVAALAQPASTSREIHLVLDRGTRVRGHVMMDGKPVAGAHVRAIQQAPGAIALSQADGSFVLEGVSDGPAHFVAPPYEIDPVEVVVGKTPTDDVRLEVHKRATVHGHVTRGGKPVAGADVTYLGPPQALIFDGPGAAKTDASGAYEIVGLPAGPGRFTAWDTPSKSFSLWRDVTLAAGEDQVVDLELDRSGEVIGTVVDQAQHPVPDVYVRLDITAQGGDDGCEAMTDSAGKFDCVMLTGGDYRATVAPSAGDRIGFAMAGDAPVIHVPASGAITGVRLAIVDERLSIAGSVEDDTGAPLPDVFVEAVAPGPGLMESPSTMTDMHGHFEIANLAKGAYSVHVRAADGSETTQREVAAGTRTLAIHLAHAGAIEGTLVGFAQPPRVVIDRQTNDPHGIADATVEGTAFSRAGLSPGTYTVHATAGADVAAASVEVHAGETAHVQLASRGTSRVEGTVQELGARTPVAGFRCDALLVVGGRAMMMPPDESQQTFTGPDGHFTLSAPVGRVRVMCFAPTGGPMTPAGTDVDVVANGLAHVNVLSVRTSDAPPATVGLGLTPFVLPLTVEGVAPNGPAASAGVRAGDHVVAIDGAPLDGVLPAGAAALIGNHRPGTTITLAIERAGATQNIKLVVPAR